MAWNDLGSAAAELIKGVAQTPQRYVPGQGDVRLSAAESAELTKELIAELRTSRASMAKNIAPEIGGIAMWAAAQAGVAQQGAELQKMLADLTKTEFTSTYPISGSNTIYGFAVYDLQAPAKKIFPVYSPIRNRFPRMPGRGGAVNWKQITAISGSGGSLAPVNHFLAELPSNSVGGLTLNLPPEIQWAASDVQTKYVPIGLSGSNSMVSQWAGVGFEDIRQLVSLSTLQALMLSEERGLGSGRTTAVSAPTIASTSSQAPTTGQTGLSGVTTNVFVKATCITMMGESTLSAAATQATSNGNVVTVNITAVTGAEAYNAYVSTGAADPGDASRWLMTTSGAPTLFLMGALPTSGIAANTITADTTANANAYLGYLRQMEAGSAYITSLNRAIALNDIDTGFFQVYNSVKGDPEELWAAAGLRQDYSQLVLAQAGSAANGYRVAWTSNEQSGVTAGVVVTAVLNKVTGREVPLRVHPWFKPGNLVGFSYTLPFPNSEVPNVWEVKLPQDYIAIDWPVIDMNYRTSVIAFGALIGYAPAFNFWLRGVYSSNPTPALQ
ncbi:MAG TPA: hypothetical protein VJ741_15715 [Solirubrobacteraceae bacterium]|nr:hypothetical protein [Solirubrobacteraceae bacterium]